MTRATQKPLYRVILAGDDRLGLQEMVAGVTDLEITLRPIRSRRAGRSEVTVPWGAIYLHAMQARVDAELRARGRRRRAHR